MQLVIFSSEEKIWDYQSFKNKKMWDVKKEISHHEKMVRILEMIDILNNRILGIKKYELFELKDDFLGIKKFHKERIETNEKMKLRLINYYNNQKK